MPAQIEVEVRQNELLTVKEVAKYLRVGQVTIWRWCQQGQIPALRIGRSWRIHRDDLFNFLKNHNLSHFHSATHPSSTENGTQENS
jgi:excisionase family DNA binding protein